MVNPVCFKMHIAYSSIIHPWNLSNSFNSWSKTNCRWRGQRGEHLATIHDKIVQKKNVYLSRSNHIYIWATIRICRTHLYMKRTSEAVGPRNDGALTGNAGFQRGLGDTTAKPSPKWSPLGRRTFVKYRLPCLSSYKRDRKTKACDEMAWTPVYHFQHGWGFSGLYGRGWLIRMGRQEILKAFFGISVPFFFAFHIFPPFFWHIPKLVSSCCVGPPNLWGERWYDALMGFVAFVYQGAKGRKDVKDLMDRGVFFWNTNFSCFFADDFGANLDLRMFKDGSNRSPKYFPNEPWVLSVCCFLSLCCFQKIAGYSWIACKVSFKWCCMICKACPLPTLHVWSPGTVVGVSHRPGYRPAKHQATVEVARYLSMAPWLSKVLML